MVCEPWAPQLTLYGPAPLPLAIVPPPKFQLYVAVPDGTVATIVTFCPIQVDEGFAVKVALAESTFTVLDAVDEHPLSVTVTDMVFTPALLQLILYGPPPLPLTVLAPAPKLQL